MTLSKPRLRDTTDRAWFSRLLRHPARKWSKSILIQPGSRTGPDKTDIGEVTTQPP